MTRAKASTSTDDKDYSNNNFFGSQAKHPYSSLPREVMNGIKTYSAVLFSARTSKRLLKQRRINYGQK